MSITWLKVEDVPLCRTCWSNPPWDWYLVGQSRGVSREPKGSFHPGKVDLGLTAAQSGGKAPVDSFHALLWVQFAEYLQHGYLPRAVYQPGAEQGPVSLPKVSDVGMARCSISGCQNRYKPLKKNLWHED